jgi:hypothetical protein
VFAEISYRFFEQRLLALKDRFSSGQARAGTDAGASKS